MNSNNKSKQMSQEEGIGRRKRGEGGEGGCERSWGYKLDTASDLAAFMISAVT